MKTIFKNFILKVITWEAKTVLKKYKPKVVAVTGSVGKTSAKDAIYTALASTYKTRKSQKSFNSEFGVPLTILNLPNGWSNPFRWLVNIVEGLIMIVFKFNYPEWLVLEVGADKPGDIKAVAEWIKPDVAVMTRLGEVPVHVEFFPSIEDLITEKGYLAQNLKQDGVLIVNHDDKRIMHFAETILNKKITFGVEAGSDVLGEKDTIIYGLYNSSTIELPKGITFSVTHGGVTMPLTINDALGKQHMYPYLAAIAVGLSQNINLEVLVKALEHSELPKGRMRLLPGIKDTLVIDDTYNSSPVAVNEGLETLKKIKVAGRKIAMLGDMMELGEYSVEQHRKAGTAASKVVDLLVTVGIRSRGTADAALDADLEEGKVLQFENSKEAGEYLSEHLEVGDVIYVKGSQSMRMERAVEELMVHREEKEKYLVRQDAEWLAKK